MKVPVKWRASAQADLFAIYDWIEDNAGADTATTYTDAVVAYVGKLAELPGWGSPRDDLAPGIRAISYRRRTMIAYRYFDDRVEIIHVAHGGRDLGRSFSEWDD